MMAAVLGTGAMMVQVGWAQSDSTAPSSAAMTPDAQAATAHPSDAMFVKKAIRGNNAEIDAAKMALQKSQNQQVKDFAQKMVDDHTKMLDSLHTVAQQENIKYQDTPSPMGQKLAAKLQTLDGTAFDKAYVDGMVKDHKMDVHDFTAEVNHGQKQDVKDAASQSLPTIKQHLQMVEGLQKQVG